MRICLKLGTDGLYCMTNFLFCVFVERLVSFFRLRTCGRHMIFKKCERPKSSSALASKLTILEFYVNSYIQNIMKSLKNL